MGKRGPKKTGCGSGDFQGLKDADKDLSRRVQELRNAEDIVARFVRRQQDLSRHAERRLLESDHGSLRLSIDASDKKRRRKGEAAASRKKRLCRLSASQRKRLFIERKVDREKRLLTLSQNQDSRLGNELPRERKRRLTVLSENQKLRLANETVSGRASRLARLAQNRSNRKQRVSIQVDDVDKVATKTVRKRSASASSERNDPLPKVSKTGRSSVCAQDMENCCGTVGRDLQGAAASCKVSNECQDKAEADSVCASPSTADPMHAQGLSKDPIENVKKDPKRKAQGNLAKENPRNICSGQPAADDESGFDPSMMTAEFMADMANVLHARMWNLKQVFCPNCKERFPDLRLCKKTGFCQRCSRNPVKFSAANDMDPGPVPETLQGLTPAEEILISAVVPIMQVYHRPLGQYAYSGNIINIPQDVRSVADVLPRLPSEMSVLVMRKEGSQGTFKDFRVRRERVQQALEWLIENNPFYKGISLSQDRLSLLPDDAIVEPDCGYLDTSITACREGCDLKQADHVDLSPVEADMTSTFLPVSSEKSSERKLKECRVDEILCDQEEQIIPWPKLDVSSPVNEFDTCGYIVLSHPTLFPWGKADLHSSARCHENVKPLDYFQHLMRYDDGRFARHYRFRYFALNTILRHRAITTGRIFIRQNPEEAKLSIDDLLKMARVDKRSLMKKITRFSQSLPGSAAYWGVRRQELLQLIKFKRKLPTIFFTLSSADLQWPDLHRLMPGYSTRSQAVNENPLLCVWFFLQRLDGLLNTVMKNELKMEDYWGRFEFQHRGSIHFHGLAWLTGAPDVTLLPTMSPAEVSDVVKFFHELVTTVNPVLDGDGCGDLPNIPVNPASVPYFRVDLKSRNLDYLGLIVYCHTHTCREGFCRRMVNGTSSCRFHFPFELAAESRIDVTENEGGGTSFAFVSKRNDPKINSHNRRIASVHRANTDMQPVLDKKKVVGYCTKYVCKTECSSDSMKYFAAQALAVSSPSDPVRQLTQKVLIQLVGGRDYSAQETMHLLMSFPQYRCSRTFVPLFLSGDRELVEQDGEPVVVSTLVDRYCKRPKELDALSLCDFYAAYSATGSKTSKRRRHAVVVPRGLGKVSRDSPHFEEYARKHLMMNVPFRNVLSLRGSYDCYADAYDVAFQDGSFHNGFDLTEDVLQTDLAEEESGHPAVVAKATGFDSMPTEFSDLLKLHPVFQSNLNDGADFDWGKAFRDQPDLFESARQFEANMHVTDLGGNIDIGKLNVKQAAVYNEISSHLIAKNLDPNTPPLLKIVTGTAGTGKSFLISCIKNMLGHRCVVLAPTGIAACNVGGQTVNSALRIPIVSARNFCELRGQALEDLQERWKDIEYLIVDEMSMIGTAKLSMIDRRLRQAFPKRSDSLFGGLSFVMIGDFGQLPPPGDTRLYSKATKDKFEAAGSVAYQSFKSSTTLETVVRQDADSGFRELLGRLRVGKVSRADYELLKSRFVNAMPGQQAEFREATRLFAKRCDVTEYNVKKLCELGKPIAYVEAEHVGGPSARKADSDDAGGLEAYTMLAEGAKVMLTANLNVDVGLCNGTIGTVEKIVYRGGNPPSLPHVVLCRFPNYRGKAFIPGEPHLFPVVPVTRRFALDGMECSRTALPLRLAFGLTIHKSQGLTLDKVVLSLGDKEFATGLTFVGMSRVRRLSDMLIVPFPFSRIEKIGSRVKRKSRDEQTPMELLRFEDSRLLVLERGESFSESLRSPDVPIARAAKHSQNNVAVGSSQVPGQYVPFRPITDSDRMRLSDNLGFVVSQRVVQYGNDKYIKPTVPPILPGGIVNVAGDGSCFYHAVSYALTNCPHYDGELRDLCEAYLEDHPHIIPHGLLEETLEDIRNRTGWADPKVVVTMANALDVSIFVYQKHGDYLWESYHPSGGPSSRGIYLFHCDPAGRICLNRQPSHFALVVDVSPII